MSNLYDSDFVAWAEGQATLLKQRRFERLDLDHLIEEVEDLANRHRDALESHLRIALTHLLKLAYTQGSRDPAGNWQHSILGARKSIRRLLRKYPSLRTALEPLSRDAYLDASEDAHDELARYGDSHATFPDTCPWTPEQVLEAPLEGPNTLFSGASR